MVISKPHLTTHLSVWTPRYHDKKDGVGEYVALLHKRKVDQGTGSIIVEFPKAKHLQGQRFAIKKQYAQSHPLGSNGTAAMYEIPISHFEPWSSAQEALEEIKSFGW